MFSVPLPPGAAALTVVTVVVDFLAGAFVAAGFEVDFLALVVAIKISLLYVNISLV
jgi:uncharacterized membrane protein YphA (DoxX/SURF4 family)